MPESRTKNPLYGAFGGTLKRLRERFARQRGRDFSHEAIAILVAGRLKKLGPDLTFSGPTLSRWEAGQVGNPDPLALRELAAIYDTTFAALTRVLLANRENPRLHERTAFALLEAADDIPASNPEPSPTESTFTDLAVETAARLITASDELAQLAERLLHQASRRQAPASGDSPTARDAGHRKTRR